MVKNIREKLKILTAHSSFWKVVVLGFFCVVVARHFIHKTEDVSHRQSVVPIAREISVSGYAPILRASGFTKPIDHGILKANFKAVVEKVLIQRGRSVKKGDVILILSSPEIEKRLVEAKSRHKEKLAEYNSAKKLTQKAFKSENAYLTTETELDQSVANLYKAETDAKELKVTAIDDGYLEECFVNVGDTVFAQDKLVQIVYKNECSVRLYVSEENISALNIGMKADVKIANKKYISEVSGVSNMAETNTRNFYVDLTIKSNLDTFPFGATVEAFICLPERKGFWINASALTLNDEGSLGVKILENGVVAFVPVNLSSLSEEGAYVEYNAASINLIAYGGEFLLPGQKPIVHWQKNIML